MGYNAYGILVYGTQFFELNEDNFDNEEYDLESFLQENVDKYLESNNITDISLSVIESGDSNIRKYSYSLTVTSEYSYIGESNNVSGSIEDMVKLLTDEKTNTLLKEVASTVFKINKEDVEPGIYLSCKYNF